MKNWKPLSGLVLLSTSTALAGGGVMLPITTAVRTVPVSAPKTCTPGAKAKAAIDLLTRKGIVDGYSQFDWCNPITRQEVAQMLAQVLQQVPQQPGSFNARELEVLRQGAAEAKAGVNELRAQVQHQDRAIAELRAQVAALEAAIKNLQNAQVAGAQGPKGEKGDTGERGEKGDKGDQGIPGRDFVPPAPEARYGTYLAGTVYGVGQHNKGLMGRVSIGNDQLSGGLGVRLTGDFKLKGCVPGNTVSAAATYRASSGRIDGILGVGAGYNLDRKATFGELSVGVDYRLVDHVAIYGEARQHYYFSGGHNVGSLVAGLKLRF